MCEQTSGLLNSFFQVIGRRLNIMYRRFGALCLFHLHRWCEEEEEEEEEVEE